MNDERVIEEFVTKFVLNTCRLRPRLTRVAAEVPSRCAQCTSNPVDDADAIPLTTGSVAEFYIEPMLPHIGDIDVMFHYTIELAIPRGHPPPTHLPDEFHNYVRVCEIIDKLDAIADSHLPGYVYLRYRYLLTECLDDGKYNAVEYEEQMCLSNRCWDSHTSDSIHGPALVTPSNYLSFDAVRCVRCLVWPSQADTWPTRHRNYGWPDSATVDRVVNNGCDVVPVAHRQCRQHEWMRENQWRLSFSRAEIVLINSWMPVQQIIYHMLRVFVKTERLTDSADNSETLSNYHIKTLMLWGCELKSQSWWTDDLNLVKICAHLLHTMGDWLTDARCQHYFINNCNLINNSFNVTNIGGQLMAIDATWLSKWFLDNYVRKCTELCPKSISRLLDEVTATTKVDDAVSAVVAWRRNNFQWDLWDSFEIFVYKIADGTNRYSLKARLCVCWMTELAKVDSRLFVYFTAVAFLHVAYKLSRHGLNYMLMDVLATLFGQLVTKKRFSNTSTSQLSLGQAVKLMKFIANKSHSSNTLLLIAIELSKAYLCRALTCKDPESDSVYCLANVYLAILYYTTRQYQTAIDHCTLVIRSQDHSQCSSHVVQGELLPAINDDVDCMLGLAVFYQYIQATALNHQCPAQHVSVFTTELFAYYLHIKINYQTLSVCSHIVQRSSTAEFKQYKFRINDIEQLFIGDVLLSVSLGRTIKHRFHHKTVSHKFYQPTMNFTEYSTSDLVKLLQKSAVEHFTAFRQIEAQDFGSLATIVTTDFEALYAYKRGDYQRCLQLSTQNVHTLLRAERITSIPTFSEFIQLMDDDIVSLIALTLIVNPKCRDDGRPSNYVCISQLTLSLYLMTQCQLKLRHSVTSLAQTLDSTAMVLRRLPSDIYSGPSHGEVY